jgi:2-phospho-L-lactate guanylyltransferase (CobY/MobA/RfbA family)
MLVGWLVGPLVGPSVPTLKFCEILQNLLMSKTRYVAIASRLGFGNNLVIIKSTTERLKFKFFSAGIGLLKAMLYRGFSVCELIAIVSSLILFA